MNLRTAKRRIADVASEHPRLARWALDRDLRRSLQVEPELRLLELLVRNRTFIDVGANRGIYAQMALNCGASGVVCIEPLPWLARRLRNALGTKAKVRCAVVTTRQAPQVVRVPIVSGRTCDTRASLDGAAGDCRQVQAEPLRLDDLGLASQSVIKIDVEGHEIEALQSAGAMLEAGVIRAIIIESEERHRPGAPQLVFELLERAPYLGWVIQARELIPISQYDRERHQSPQDAAIVEAGGPRPVGYANNFCFVHRDDAETFLRNLPATGFRLRA